MDVLTSSEQSYSYGLTTIPRAATISDADNFTDEGNPRVWFSNPGRFKLRFKLEVYGGGSVYATRDVSNPGSPYTFSLTTSERNAMRSDTTTSNTRSIGVVIQTFLSSTPSNSVYVQRTLTITNAYPSFSSSQFSYKDSNSSVVAITGNNQQIVQNKSSFQYTFTSATAQKYASISKYDVTFNGSTTSRSGSGTYTIGTVNSSGNQTLQIKVIDSRGNYTTVSKTVTFLPWQSPTATITANRKNNFETETYIKANTSISSINGKNSLQTLQYRYKKSSESTYSNWIDLPNNTQTTISIDNTIAWNFQVQLSDKFGTNSYSFTIAKGQPIMFFDTNKISVGVNTFPANSNSFETQNLYVNGKSILNLTYPVGSIYMSVNSTSPATLFGGTWSALYNYFLIGAGSSYSAGSTGGSSSRSLSTSNMPSHSHSVSITTSSTGSHTHGLPRNNSGSAYREAIGYTTSSDRAQTTNTDSAGSHSHSVSGTSGSTGSGSSFSIVPPYYAVYMWRRTA
jgi:hypothetical protein